MNKRIRGFLLEFLTLMVIAGVIGGIWLLAQPAQLDRVLTALERPFKKKPVFLQPGPVRRVEARLWLNPDFAAPGTDPAVLAPREEPEPAQEKATKPQGDPR
jgi:hypothetical protein